MTQTTFVRLEEADLAEMAKRLHVILTDEGAHAWYKHDVAELLQEVVALRQERATAIESFREHDALSGVPDSLPLIAAAWREQVTGLWEKAQVKKLRAETAQARQELAESESKLADAERRITDVFQVNGEIESQLSAVYERFGDQQESWRASQAEYVARIVELEAQVSALMDEKATEQERVAAMVKAVEDSYAARAVRVNQLLSEAGATLG